MKMGYVLILAARGFSIFFVFGFCFVKLKGFIRIYNIGIVPRTKQTGLFS